MQLSLITKGCTQEQRLSARARAQVEHAVSWCCSDAGPDELRAFVLNLKQPGLVALETENVGSSVKDEPVGRVGAWSGHDAFSRELFREGVPIRLQSVGPHRDGAREIGCSGKGFGLGPQCCGQLDGEPVWVRETRGPVRRRLFRRDSRTQPEDESVEQALGSRAQGVV